MTPREKLVSTARAELGYLEKATNTQLDNKTANKGKANYNKYARDIDTQYPTWYNTKKNGYYWCTSFADWCYIKAFGYDNAKKMLCQPEKSYGASCTYAVKYFNKAKKFKLKGVYTPKVGDRIFFINSKKEIHHTGIVVGVANGRVKTIEGNTSAMVGVRNNGDGVYEKEYNITSSAIYGYGIVDFSIIAEEPSYTQPEKVASGTPMIVDLKIGSKGSDVELLQAQLNKLIDAKLLSGTKLTVDGYFGTNTKKCLMSFQTKYNLYVDGIYGVNSRTKMNNVLELLKQVKSSYNVKITSLIGVNMRAGYATSYAKILAIPFNKVVTITDEKNGWGYCSYNGKKGWIKLSNTKRV